MTYTGSISSILGIFSKIGLIARCVYVCVYTMHVRVYNAVHACACAMCDDLCTMIIASSHFIWSCCETTFLFHGLHRSVHGKE